MGSSGEHLALSTLSASRYGKGQGSTRVSFPLASRRRRGTLTHLHSLSAPKLNLPLKPSNLPLGGDVGVWWKQVSTQSSALFFPISNPQSGGKEQIEVSSFCGIAPLKRRRIVFERREELGSCYRNPSLLCMCTILDHGPLSM